MSNRFQIEDPTIEIRRRVAEINRGVPPEAMMDEQELAEREQAAQAYAGENETHFVRFLDDCVQTSVEAMTEIRANQQECWDVYNELEPPNYAFKEKWQTRVIVPKPYSSCQFAQAIVRKAFDTQFLSIENERDKESAEFWRKLMDLQLSRNYANFPINFTDATGMSFAIGQSMEMIPVYRPGKGLRYILTEPWKIHRDPDAISRQPQSGMYWVHQEWLDYYALKQAEKDGRYVNIGDMGPGGSWGNPKADVNMTQEEIARRKGMLWNRSTYRTMVLTSEFWGTVLSPRGELLLPNATFTVAGDRVIGLPKSSPYPTLRWPGIGFSALPHLLRFDGRGLVQGIKSLWYFMNSLLCLHADNLNWIVNPMTETDISSLVDQSDVDIYPGKNALTRGTVNGQPVVRTVDRRSNTGDILANMNFADQRAQEGMMLNYAAQGLPGYRAEVTAREAAQNLDQSMTVFGLIGKNLEDGALNAILAGAETVAINITYDELAFLMGPEVAEKYRDPESPTGVTLPQLSTGSYHVSGISALMRDQEIINSIAQMIVPLFDPNGMGRVFSAYLKPYNLLKSIETRLNLKDEGIIVSQDDADRIDEAQQAQQEAAIEAQKQKEAAEAEAAQNASLKEVSEAHLNVQEADAHAAKAELSRAQADATAHQGQEHAANAELARQNAIQVASTPPPQPQPEAAPGGAQ